MKIYKNSVDGNETILQLLSNHDSILEESIFIGSNFYASAQTTSDTELFSLPITIIDNSIKKHEISANITTIVSHKLQFLNNEIEYIKSKSVNQKIGFFLLQLFNKNNRVNKINLPYSKSLIANYLGISRESFSRSLNALDKNDFKIEKNIVTVINEHSLCRYCSGNISNNCPSYRKHQCSRR